jgi:hypothetical protein
VHLHTVVPEVRQQSCGELQFKVHHCWRWAACCGEEAMRSHGKPDPPAEPMVPCARHVGGRSVHPSQDCVRVCALTRQEVQAPG